MTKPTPAQIEAAIGAYGVVLSQAFTNDGAPPSVLRNAMSAALTAAAEVGDASARAIAKAKAEYTDAIKRTAAAEVGEPQWHLEQLEWHNAQIAATIERCAQVIEAHPETTCIAALAAAIRALKDRP